MDLKNIIERKKSDIEAGIRAGQMELSRLEKQEKTITGKGGIEKWLGNDFESSSGVTEEWRTFANDYRRELKKQLCGYLELVSFNRGHFYISGFVKNRENGRFAYFSTDDVRYNSGDTWYNNILVQTAEHDKDFTGGRNNTTDWQNLSDKLLDLTIQQ